MKQTRKAITNLEQLLKKEQWTNKDCETFKKASDSLCNPKTKEN